MKSRSKMILSKTQAKTVQKKRQTADCRPSDDRQTTNSRPTVG